MIGDKSAQHWEKFARRDPQYYVLTAGGDFFESGRQVVDQMMEDVGSLLPGRELAIEIGCGIGRLAIPMASTFDKVFGVDVSPTMLRKMEEECNHVGVSNVVGLLPHELWDRPGSADLVYSYWVFQHIESSGVIARYIQRAARCLREQGIAFLQFDTRPITTAYRIRNLLPDGLLPRPWRRGIRRIRRHRPAILSLFARHGLRLLEEEGSNSEANIFVLQRT